MFKKEDIKNEKERVKAIEEIKAKKKNLETLFQQIKKPFEDEISNLSCLEREISKLYFVGDRVKVEETCSRGCCIETSYIGTIIESYCNTHGNMIYKIQSGNEITEELSWKIKKRILRDGEKAQ